MSLLEGEGRWLLSRQPSSPSPPCGSSLLKLEGFLFAQERFWGRCGPRAWQHLGDDSGGESSGWAEIILSKVPVGVSRHKRLLPQRGPAGADETGCVQRTELFLPIWSCYSWCNSPDFRPRGFSKSLLQLTQSLPHLHILLSNSGIQKCSLLV